MSRLMLPGSVLEYQGQRLEPFSLDKNIAGLCQICDQELVSLAYHRSGSRWLVSAKCRNEHLVLMCFDQGWNWVEDLDLETASSFARVSDLKKEQLEAVFTPAEIRTLLSCEMQEPYVRQNLYRARAKYDRFEKLFGIKLNL
ncbi:MAG TPA: hypothetical protein VN455_00615 [Methanotrichaceae archaeon]|nr:hypothetical protein [Methanotrichaceae archaeon]